MWGSVECRAKGKKTAGPDCPSRKAGPRLYPADVTIFCGELGKTDKVMIQKINATAVSQISNVVLALSGKCEEH